MMMKEKKRVPMLRFEGFEGEYKRRLFDDVFIFSTGKNIKQKEAAPEFETPCIRYGELYYMYGEVIYEIINKTNLDKSELHFSEGNEILLPSAGEDPLDIGLASALNFKDIAIGRTINILRPKEENVYSQNYVSYYINEKLKKKIATLAKGVSISNVYNSDLRGLKINLPTIDEQQKIALFLTSIDTRIQLLEKKKTLLEQYKKGVMQRIFKQEVRFKRDDGEEFGEWEKKSVSEMFRVTRGNVLSMTKVSDFNEGEYMYPVYSSQTKNGGLSGFYNEYLYENALTWTTDGANAGDVNYRTGKFYCTNVCGVLLSDEGYANTFIAEKLNSITRKYVSYVGNPKLMNGVMSEIVIEVPSIPEQTKIAHFLSSLDTKIAVIEQQIVGMKEWKKGVLQRMFV